METHDMKTASARTLLGRRRALQPNHNRDHQPRRSFTTRAGAAIAAAAIVMGACGSDDTATDTGSAVAAETTSESGGSDGVTDTTLTTEPAPIDTEPTGTPPTKDLSAEIQAIIDASMRPGALQWNCCGADGPPTGVSVAVRAPGIDDILLAAGTNVDGTPFSTSGSFNLGSNSQSVLRTLAYQLLDDGVLDPAATVDTWLPTMPNADRVTVQMMLDDTTGWKDFSDEATGAITADLSRRWTIAEVVDTLADNPPLAEPGTFVVENSRRANMVGLAAVIEGVTGRPLAEVLNEQFLLPAGLDNTLLSDGTDQPANFQHGVFVLNNAKLDTSMVPNTAFYTYNVAESAIISTLADSLDMIDMWSDGSLFTSRRLPGPDTFRSDRRDGNAVVGYGIPFNGFCPCAPDGDGLTVTKYGRTGNNVGTDTQMLHFPDGISIVLHYNSEEWSTKDGLTAISDTIHEAVSAAI